MTKNQTQLRMEAEIADAIEKVIDKYCEEAGFYFVNGVSVLMGEAAMMILRVTSETAGQNK